jgi:PTS system nitrogen regulatory IIA component
MPVSRDQAFWKLFKVKNSIFDLKSDVKEDVLVEIVANLVKAGAIDESLTSTVLQALREREELASTGIGQNVAIPHVKVAGIDEAVTSLCAHKEGVEWAAVDGEPVNVFFVVLRPEEPGANHDPERHLEMMRWIADLARNRDFRVFAARSKTRKELVDLLKEMSTR